MRSMVFQSARCMLGSVYGDMVPSLVRSVRGLEAALAARERELVSAWRDLAFLRAAALKGS